MAFTYEYPRPSVTADCVVFGIDEDTLKVVLIERPFDPLKGWWALPGGFVNPDETLENAATRKLKDDTGMSKVFLEQLYTFGDPDRDPNDRVITVAYYALVNLSNHPLESSSLNATWFPVSKLPKLAFDHKKIIQAAISRLRSKVRYMPIGFSLLPQKFTLTQLQRLYETVLERELDKRNFRKKILHMDILVELDEYQKGVAHRKARLYRFDQKKYRMKKEEGFYFQI